MKKVELFLEKYNNSKLREKIKNVSEFLDVLVQKYIIAVCNQFPVDEKCIDNLLRIEDFTVEPIEIGGKGHAGALSADFDEKTFSLHYELKFSPNIDISFLENGVPNNLAENEIDYYKREAARNIVVFLHELTHAIGYIKFLKYDEVKKGYVDLSKEDVAKEDYTYYVERGGLITGRTVVHGKEMIKGTNLNNNYLYEALTEFVAHNVLLDEAFKDLQYLHLSTGEIDPYSILWTYSPFVNIIFALNCLYDNAYAIAYFTGDTKIAGFTKDCLNVDIADISIPINEIIHYFNDGKREKIDLGECVHLLVNGIKRFLNFIENTLKREDVKQHIDEFRFKSLNNEIQNICHYNYYFNFIMTKCEIDDNDYEKLRQIFEKEFQQLKPITIEKSNLNI